MRGYYDGPSKNNEIDLNQSSNNRNEQRMDLNRSAVPGDGGQPPPAQHPDQVQRPAGARKDASEL